MVKQLTIEDITRLKSALNKDQQDYAALIAIYSHAESQILKGESITWNPPDPIPPRPWSVVGLSIHDANDKQVAHLGGNTRFSEGKDVARLVEFIVECVNDVNDGYRRD